MKATKLEGGELHISRLIRSHSHPVTLKRVVQYSPNWVKNQQRMASNSNQETFRIDIDGRLTIDILRHVSFFPFSLSQQRVQSWSPFQKDESLSHECSFYDLVSYLTKAVYSLEEKNLPKISAIIYPMIQAILLWSWLQTHVFQGKKLWSKSSVLYKTGVSWTHSEFFLIGSWLMLKSGKSFWKNGYNRFWVL